MKAICLAGVVCLGFAVCGWGQDGLVVFNNRIAARLMAPVFGPEPGDASIALHGNPPAGGLLGGLPAGTQVYHGLALAGTGYTAQLWGGPGAAGPGYNPILQLVGTTVFRTGNSAGYVQQPSTSSLVPGVAPGEFASFEFLAWDNRGGTITTWAQVQADPTVLRGSSGVFSPPSPLGGGINPPSFLDGLQSFSLHAVPEPGLGWLALAGAAAACAGRRVVARVRRGKGS